MTDPHAAAKELMRLLHVPIGDSWPLIERYLALERRAQKAKKPREIRRAEGRAKAEQKERRRLYDRLYKRKKAALRLAKKRDLANDNAAGTVGIPSEVDSRRRRTADESAPNIEYVGAD